MEDGVNLNQEDKQKLADLLKELESLKTEHKAFASNKVKLTPHERELWRINSQRTNQVHIEVKELRIKNILEAGR